MSDTIASQPATAEDQATVAEADEFDTANILTIVSGHFIHDTYTAFVPTILPLMIEKLSLSLTQAGSLTVFLQLPAIFNIFIGYLADRVSLRYFVIFAPAVTATLISALGLPSTYVSLAILLFVAGVSVATFHVPAPAMIGHISGKRVGRGMSLFMAGGELGRSVGPLLVVWGVDQWALDGIWRLAVFGWAASVILFWRLRHISAQSKEKRQVDLRAILPVVRSVFVPLGGLMLLRNLLVAAVTTYLVVLLESEGYTLGAASRALALWSFAGVGGAMVGGTLSDTFGRKRTIALAAASSALLMVVFLQVSGWMVYPLLVLLGFTALSVTPVMQAVVLEHLPGHRATGMGIFMLMIFLIRSGSVLLIGALGDEIGLRPTFLLCAVATILAIPVVFTLPDLRNQDSEPKPESDSLS